MVRLRTCSGRHAVVGGTWLVVTMVLALAHDATTGECRHRVANFKARAVHHRMAMVVHVSVSRVQTLRGLNPLDVPSA
jgi:hypothetical protein